MRRRFAQTIGATMAFLELRTPLWRVFASAAALALVATAALLPFPAAADVFTNGLAQFLGTMLSFCVEILGKLLLLAIYLLTWVASYNNFLDSSAVANGWVIVRDVGNMFFIVVLLITAFATILNVGAYEWKKMLPSLLLAAILINFSKTIAGLLIDVSQVIMLTFVNGFAAAAGGNFANMYQIQNLLSVDATNPEFSTSGMRLMDVVGGYVIAMFMIIIALITTFVMTVIMTFRIVMLWILIVLSPAPYILGLIPQGKKYADKWWEMFGQYLIVGPVLAFFLWLALVSVGTGAASSEILPPPAGSESDAGAASLSVGKTTAGSKESMLSFLISIAMLIGGLKIAGEMGVMGAGMAKGAADKMGSMAKGAAYKLSGARAVRERWDAFQKMREAGRQDKVQASAARITSAYGAVLSAPGKGMAKLASAAPSVLTPFQHQAQKAREAAKTARAAGDIATAQRQEARARRFDVGSKIAGATWKAGMVAAAPVTGGASLIGLVPAGLRQMGRAGEAAKKKSKQYKYDAVTKAMDAMKDTKPADVTGKIYDGTATSTDRMAAFLKATKDGLLKTSEVENGEKFLTDLGADEKTMNTFKSYAEQGHYAGTMLKGNRAEQQKRIAGGWMPTKDLHPEELTRDDGSLVADFVLKGNDDQRKELRKSKAHGAAYKQGTQSAVTAAQTTLAGLTPGTADHTQAQEDLQKLQTELMQLGTDKNEKAAGKSSFDVSGMDLTTFGKALQTVAAPGMLANVEQKDLAIDPTTGTSAFLDTIVQNVKGSHFRAGRGAAQKDNDPAKLQAFTALENAIKNSTRFKNHDRGQATVRGALGNVSGVKKAFDKASALLATDQGNAAYQADVTRLEGDLNTAERQMKDAQTAFEDAMNAAGIGASERELYESMKSKRK